MTGDPIEAIRACRDRLQQRPQQPRSFPLSPGERLYVDHVGLLLSELDGLRARTKGNAQVPEVCLACGNNWRRAKYPNPDWMIDLECTRCPVRFYGLRRDQKEWNAALEAALAEQLPPVVRTYTGSLDDALTIDAGEAGRGVLLIPEELEIRQEDLMPRPFKLLQAGHARCGCGGTGAPVPGSGGNTETRPWWECGDCGEMFTDPAWKPPHDPVKAAGLRGLNALLRPLARWRR